MPRTTEARKGTRGRRTAPRPAVTEERTGLLSDFYIVLEGKHAWEDVPRHLLDVPPGWARVLDGEFRLRAGDFVRRELAIADAAVINSEAMTEATGDWLPHHWALVFQLADVESTSFVLVEHGCVANFHIDTCITLVRPTEDEIEPYRYSESMQRLIEQGGVR